MNVLFTFGIQRMCLIDKVMLTEVQVRRVTLNVKFWRHECCVGQTSSEQCMLGQIQWMSSSLCNSALRLSTVERSSSFWEGSKCYTHMQKCLYHISDCITSVQQQARKSEREEQWCCSPAFSPPAASWSLAGEHYCCWQGLLLYCDSNSAEKTHTYMVQV